MRTAALLEFHVSRRARDAYGFEDSLFAFDGNVIFADFAAARTFAGKINAVRPRDRAVRPGEINALGLIDESLHFIVEAYRRQKNIRVMREALEWLTLRLGPDAVATALRRFVEEFPPVAVYRNRLTVDEYLAGETGGRRHSEIALEEMLMLRLANLNPAFRAFQELFDDARLAEDTAYARITTDLRDFFASQPGFGPGDRNLVDVLRAPALAAPDSLAGQLEFLRGQWGFLLGPRIHRLLRGLDFIKEEDKASFGGPGPSALPVFGSGAQAASLALFGSSSPGPRPPDPEPERFSPDLDWMPNLVLIAKNTYVWLDQLSAKYGRPIVRLDQIPDEELDELRSAGITGLWLIGVWERSTASREIKRRMGNPEAEASAYSVYDYDIAGDLGGDPALGDLRARALRRGIRLASDMVPNHMGIDSRWVIEHPERFIALDEPPFPAYAFTGPDLSTDSRVGIRIEDHYYQRSDAAVVFERTDRWTGSVRYVYHGNDGTSYPWNDTAQLDFLKPETREAVIQTILHVARSFPIVRFDAAMTLTRRHYQRLWFPEPGTGGAIPSRAEHGLTREDFDAAMPSEFWRELVDRASAETPGTLLLAEAFWLLEGYFVRTLGMHRVYNSAFMNMLRDESNAKYRRVLKQTLEFDPEILKRFVNFMNNPDEKTAVEQFGDGDKYFGVATLLATLPGLPMVGHGQVEGFSEKYGMEYRRAYYGETPKPWLIERHRREVFPLFCRRALFAGVDHFVFYDAFADAGPVDENVFAYSNGRDGDRALVVYNNVFGETRVWIRASAAKAVRTGGGDGRALVRDDLGKALGLGGDPAVWVIFKDLRSGLEHIRNSRILAEQGFFIELKAYECHVFMGFREIAEAADGRYARLAAELNGGGVPSVERAAHEVLSRPVRAPFRDLVNPGFFSWLIGERILLREGKVRSDAGRQAVTKSLHVWDGIRYISGASKRAGKTAAAATRRDFEAILRLPVAGTRFPKPKSRLYGSALSYLYSGLPVKDRSAPGGGKAGARPKSAGITPPQIDCSTAWAMLFCWAAVKPIGRAFALEHGLDEIIAETIGEMGADEGLAGQASQTVMALASLTWRPKAKGRAAKAAREIAEALFTDAAARSALYVHEYQGISYFNKEAFERMTWALMATAVVELTADPNRPAGVIPDAIIAAYRALRALHDAEAKAGYRVDELISALSSKSPGPKDRSRKPRGGGRKA